MIVRILVFLFLLPTVGSSFAQLRVPGIISDNMVLQQGSRNAIWGWAAADSKINLSFAGQTRITRAQADGKWIVYLDEMPAANQGRDMEIKSVNETIIIKNVLVGEVWLCSGQSNMNRPVKELIKRKNDTDLYISETARQIEAAMNQEDPLLRRFTVKKAATIAGREVIAQGEAGTEHGWAESNPENNEDWSGTAFFFARELRKQLNVPVGVICAAWGGTRIESWMPEQAFIGNEVLEPILKRQRAMLEAGFKKNTPEGIAAYEKNLELYRRKMQEYKSLGQKPPATLRPPVNPATLKDNAANFTSLFNGMIAPVIPYGIRGFIWYQGESNGSRSANEPLYAEMMKSMVSNWRSLFEQGDLPFYFVQVANYNFGKEAGMPDGFEPVALLRQQQLEASLKIKNAGMAVTIDIGEAKDIHPVNKIDVGKRLAYWALARDYGKTVSFSGPVYGKLKIQPNQIIVSFTHTGKGLMAGIKRGAQPVQEAADDELKYFQIAGKDKKWYPAKAKIISASEIQVQSDEVLNPVAVRYGWYANPQSPNLYNREGLPASPFRTDNWDVYQQ